MMISLYSSQIQLNYVVILTRSVIVFYIDIISHKELNNQISELLKNYTVVTEKYKVRIFMYPNLYGRWN
jgi:hypothetical protein